MQQTTQPTINDLDADGKAELLARDFAMDSAVFPEEEERCPFAIGDSVEIIKSLNRPKLKVTGRVVEIVNAGRVRVLWSDTNMVIGARVWKLRRAL